MPFPHLLHLLPIITSVAALATPLTTPFLPWDLTSLSIDTPTGRSGNPPYTLLTIIINDPNTISLGPLSSRPDNATFPPSTATCSTRWNSYIDESPFDKVIPCTSNRYGAPGEWTFELLRQNATGFGPNPAWDFKVKFDLEESMILDGGIVSMKFSETVGFARLDNLVWLCGVTGSCSAFLRPGFSPVMNQTGVVECVKGDCGIWGKA